MITVKKNINIVSGIKKKVEIKGFKYFFINIFDYFNILMNGSYAYFPKKHLN